MREGNVVADKSLEFAVRVVKLHKCLSERGCAFVLCNQILKSGTSIGANIREGVFAQSRNDFVAKLSIALKEVSETEYWLEVLLKAEHLKPSEYVSLQRDCGEIAKLLIATLKKTRQSQQEA